MYVFNTLTVGEPTSQWVNPLENC